MSAESSHPTLIQQLREYDQHLNKLAAMFGKDTSLGEEGEADWDMVSAAEGEEDAVARTPSAGSDGTDDFLMVRGSNNGEKATSKSRLVTATDTNNPIHTSYIIRNKLKVASDVELPLPSTVLLPIRKKSTNIMTTEPSNPIPIPRASNQESPPSPFEAHLQHERQQRKDYINGVTKKADPSSMSEAELMQACKEAYDALDAEAGYKRPVRHPSQLPRELYEARLRFKLQARQDYMNGVGQYAKKVETGSKAGDVSAGGGKSPYDAPVDTKAGTISLPPHLRGRVFKSGNEFARGNKATPDAPVDTKANVSDKSPSLSVPPHLRGHLSKPGNEFVQARKAAYNALLGSKTGLGDKFPNANDKSMDPVSRLPKTGNEFVLNSKAVPDAPLNSKAGQTDKSPNPNNKPADPVNHPAYAHAMEVLSRAQEKVNAVMKTSSSDSLSSMLTQPPSPREPESEPGALLDDDELQGDFALHKDCMCGLRY